jgi:hypothetical protein
MSLRNWSIPPLKAGKCSRKKMLQFQP